MHPLLTKLIPSSPQSKKPKDNDVRALEGAKNAGQPFLDLLCLYITSNAYNTDIKEIIKNGGRADHRLLYDRGYNDALKHIKKVIESK